MSVAFNQACISEVFLPRTIHTGMHTYKHGYTHSLFEYLSTLIYVKFEIKKKSLFIR